MEKVNLLAALNAERRKVGASLVSDRQLRDWIDEGLIAGASATGRKRGENPLWTYSDNTLAAALRILELRDKGFTRVALIRISLWVKGQLQISELVRQSFVSEFSRFVRRQHRTQRIDYDARYQTNLDDKAAAKIDRQLGYADPELKATGLVPPSPFLRRSGSAIFWEKDASLEHDLDKILEGMEIDKPQVTSIIQIFENGVSGMLGLSDETTESGVDLLRKECEDGDLEEARVFYETIAFSLSRGEHVNEAQNLITDAWQKAQRSVQEPDFLISFIALGTIAAIRARKRNEMK